MNIPVDKGKNDFDYGNMRSYKLSEKDYKSTSRTEILSRSLFVILFEIIFIGIIIYNLAAAEELMAIILIFIIISMLFQSLITTIPKLKRMKKAWASFEILIDDEKIIKLQQNKPYTEIRKEQVTAITETHDFGLIVKTNDNVKFIYIPLIIEQYDELKTVLAQWFEVEELLPTNTGMKSKVFRKTSLAHYVFDDGADNEKRKKQIFKWGCLFDILICIVLFFVITVFVMK